MLTFYRLTFIYRTYNMQGKNKVKHNNNKKEEARDLLDYLLLDIWTIVNLLECF